MSLRHIPTQYEQWFAFANQTQEVFQAFPQLFPLRTTIFRSFIEGKTAYSFASPIKYQIRRLLSSHPSVGDLSPADIVFWLDSSREAQVEAIVPVRKALSAQAVKSSLLVTSKAYPALQWASPSIEFRFPRLWQSVDHWEVAWNALRENLGDDLPEKHGPDFLLEGRVSDSIAHEAERLLKQLRAKVVVLAVEQYPPASTICDTANRLGLKTLVLQHGNAHPSWASLITQQMVVWGDISRRQMIAMGSAAERLVVLGSPRHDRFPIRSAAEARTTLRATLGLRNLPYVVFFSNLHDVSRHSSQAVTSCVQWLAEAADYFRDRLEFVIRLHPNEDRAAYSGHPELRLFKNECDLDTTMAGADVCVALSSTTMEEALLYKKPVLQFYGDGWPEVNTSWRGGLTFRIKDAAQFIETLNAGLDEQPIFGKLVDLQAAKIPSVFANHGQACQKVAEYILEQC